MIPQARILMAAVLLSAIAPATAAPAATPATTQGDITISAGPPATSVPKAAIPTFQCVRHALQSDSAVQSVDLYSADGFRFDVEYSFRNKAGQIVVYDIELMDLHPDGSMFVGDRIPIAISKETAQEAFELEMRVDFQTKCHLHGAFDNVDPEQAAQADWRKLDWPSE